MEPITLLEASKSAVGTVLARRIPLTGAFHVAIVVSPSHAGDGPLLAEHDYDGQRLVTLEEFLYGQKRVWRVSFEAELAAQGPNAFREPAERAKMAMGLLKLAKPYCAHTYNCEHFVRICTFRDSRHWSSPQVVSLLRSSSDLELWGRLAGILQPFRA